ncbi:MAG: SRPBCC domain-containing protein [Nocardioides sp.]
MHLLHDRPRGEKYAGWWRITAVDEPHSFSFDDGFADEHFDDNPDLPVSHNVYRFEAEDAATLATFTTTFDTVEGLQQVLAMGMEEGATLAINQIDGFLAG